MDSACTERIISEDYADFIYKTNNFPESILSIPDFCYDSINETYSVAYIPIAILPENLIQKYSYSIYPSCFGLLDISSLDDSGVTKIQNIPALGLTGQDVFIGIIDTGIDYTHEAFRNPDGTTRICSIWDQTINHMNQQPSGFYYGTEYTENQINAALNSSDPFSVVPSTDTDGHGTFLAGMAAGTKNTQKGFSGVATNAQLIVVKLKPAKKFLKNFYFIPNTDTCYQENDIMYGIKYLLSVAKNLSKPISICIGVGTSQDSHDARTALSSYLSAIAVQKGVGVSIAAGNEGNTGHHYSGIVDSAIGYDIVELNISPNNTGFSMELWGNSPNTFSIDILSPTGQYIPRIPARLTETRKIDFIFDNTIIYIDYELAETQTGDELILIRFQNPLGGLWRFRIYSTNIDVPPAFNIWLPIHNFLSSDTYFVTPDPYYTLTSPANTIVPIIVTAYDHTNASLYANASKGYTRANVIDPTFAAPGVNIIGVGLHHEYMVKSGSSISAAFSAGVLALFLEWGIVKNNQPGFNTPQIKNFLIRGAKRDSNLIYPNKDWGYGILDVFHAFNSLSGR